MSATAAPASQTTGKNPLVAALLSLIIPGAGQLYLGARNAALYIFVTVVVLAALTFSKHLFEPDAFLRALLAFATFCALASSVYLVNDLADLQRDRLHPLKRSRPLASGALPPYAAQTAAGILVPAALAASLLLGTGFAACATAYLGLGLAYSFVLKHSVILDVLAVAIGKRWYAQPHHPDQQILNDPTGRLVGRSATVVEAVDLHGGRVRLGDSEWSARGGPAAPGDKVRIERVEGNCLHIGRPDALPPPA